MARVNKVYLLSDRFGCGLLFRLSYYWVSHVTPRSVFQKPGNAFSGLLGRVLENRGELWLTNPGCC